MKKIILTSVLSSVLLFSQAFGAEIESIEAVNNEQVKAITSIDTVVPEGPVEGSVEIFKGLVTTYSYKDPENPQKITVGLTYDLLPNKSYTLMGILGAEADMKFNTKGELIGEIINPNANPEKFGIEKIEIVEPKTINIFYNKEVNAEEFSYKVLQKIPVKSVIGNGLNTMEITVMESLENLIPYIVIFGTLLDMEGEEINFSEPFYSFQSAENLKVKNEDIIDPATKKPLIIEEKKEEKEGNVEEVALNSAETPPTGPATWILLLLTFLVTGTFFVKNKFSNK